MKELLEEWMQIKEQERELKEKREQIEAEIYITLKDNMPDDGSSTWHYDGYKLNIKQNYTVSVDQEKAVTRPDLFKTKYELSWSNYKKSDSKGFLDEVVTIKSGKPTFSVVME